MLKPHFESMLEKVPESTFLGVISNILQDLENPQIVGDASTIDSNPTFQRVMEKVRGELEIIYEEIEEDEDLDSEQLEAQIRRRVEAEMREEKKLGRRGRRGKNGSLSPDGSLTLAKSKSRSRSRGKKGKKGRNGRNGVADDAIWEEENEDSPTRKWGGRNRKGAKRGDSSSGRFGQRQRGSGQRGTDKSTGRFGERQRGAGTSTGRYGQRGTANSRTSGAGGKSRGTTGRKKKSKNSTSNLPPRKWRDTRKVTYLGARKDKDDNIKDLTYDQFDPRNSDRRGGDLYKLGRDNDYLNSLMNRYGPDLKKKEKAKKKRRAASRGIPGAGRGVSYFNQEPQSRRRKRNSVASSNLSEDPDGTWSNTKMLRYFVKEAVKERQGTEDELGILNRSLSEASLRIFNDIREKEHNNSPMRILDGKIHHGSRESTLSAKKNRQNLYGSQLIYEQEDRSVGNKDRELSNILRESQKKFYQQHAEYA